MPIGGGPATQRTGTATLKELPSPESPSPAEEQAVIGGCRKRIGRSTQSGKKFEEFSRTLRKGTYRLKVRSQRGASSKKKYSVRCQAYGRGVHAMTRPMLVRQRDEGWVHTYTEVLNNTRHKVSVEATIKVRNRKGEVLDSFTEEPHFPVVRPGARVPVASLSVEPDGLHHASAHLIESRP